MKQWPLDARNGNRASCLVEHGHGAKKLLAQFVLVWIDWDYIEK